jgi:hypothetical protein
MMQAIPLAMAAFGGWGTALAAAGGIYSAVSGHQAGLYQSRVAQNNSVVAMQNADRSVHEAAVQAQDQDFTAQGDMGALLSNLGASGFSLSTGSAALRRKSASDLAARDRNYTTYRGQTTADAYRQQSADFLASAKSSKMGARNALIGGAFEVGGTLITGASKVNDEKARRIAAGAGR